MVLVYVCILAASMLAAKYIFSCASRCSMDRCIFDKFKHHRSCGNDAVIYSSRFIVQNGTHTHIYCTAQCNCT